MPMIGIDPASLPDEFYTFETVDHVPTDRADDGIKDKAGRIRRVAPEWIADNYGRKDGSDWFDWKEHGHRVPVDVMCRAFSWNEIVRIWLREVIQSNVFRHIEERHQLLEKVRHSMWHYGYETSFNVFVSTVRGLRRMTWPGADVSVTHVGKYRDCGWSEHDKSDNGLWIDNDFGALVHMNGKHVLTVGFGVGVHGVYVSQIQLRQKMGNRWLYKMPSHYVDVALGMIARAFQMPIWLVDGKSAAAAVRASYGNNCKLTRETESRIETLYDRELEAFERGKRERRCGREYYLLERKPCSSESVSSTAA